MKMTKFDVYCCISTISTRENGTTREVEIKSWLIKFEIHTHESNRRKGEENYEQDEKKKSSGNDGISQASWKEPKA